MIVRNRDMPPPKRTTFAQIAVGEAFFIFNGKLYLKLQETKRQDGTHRNAVAFENGEASLFELLEEVLLVEAEVSYKVLREEEIPF